MLPAWLLSRFYFYERNKAFKSDFFVSMYANLFAFNPHFIILNLCACSKKYIFYAVYHTA
jgi:hypothetical protein